MRKERAEFLETLIYLLPAMLMVTLAIYVPFALSGFYSFTEWNGLDRAPKWIGAANFIGIFRGESEFFRTLVFTLKYAVVFMIFSNIIALALALALIKRFSLANTLRGIFFIPNIISMIIVGFIWRFIFSSGFDTFGEMTGWGIFRWSWLGDVRLAFVSVAAVGIWQSLGFYIVIYIAGLVSMPVDVLEASVVDGAAGFFRFRRITLPLLAPSISTCVFMSLINSIKVFDLILALTRGGPAGSTYSVTLGIYRDAFQRHHYGLGAAESLVFFVIVLLLTAIVLRLFSVRDR